LAVLCLLGGAGALGVAHVALLPPWEGFDEEAHYSSLQQLVDAHELPRLGTAHLSQGVESYGTSAPMRYMPNPPTRAAGKFTYRSFFEAPDDVIARGRVVVHERPPEPRRYIAGARGNWEAQHPPLYYVVLAPAYLLTRQLSWAAHLFILRSVSYLLAWLALVLGVYTCARAIPAPRHGAPDRGWLMLGVAAWPVLFPGWFPEMARLGNDSLCALLTALVWWRTARALDEGPGFGYACTLGVLLGLGWLTKVFFVPLTAGLFAFWCVRQWRLGGRRAVASLSLHLMVAGALIAAIAGWWYVGDWRVHGAALGSVEVIRLEKAGGLVSGLRQHFTVGALVRLAASFVTRLAWPSTWSLARPPYAYLVPLGLVVLSATAAYLAALRQFRPTGIEWLPAWLAAPILVGFGHHMLVRIALTGEGSGFGGYYLHFLVAPLGLALGLGVGVWWRRPGARALWVALSLYSILFAIAISWAQVLLFAGLLSKSASKFYEAPVALPPFLGLPAALGRLAAIAYPVTGAIAWLIGGGLVLVGVLAAGKAVGALPPRGDRPGGATRPGPPLVRDHLSRDPHPK
jgi:hypothetical protein